MWWSAAGCEPISPQDREYFAQRERDRQGRETILRDANKNVSTGDLIELVRKKDAPDGDGTMDDWITRELGKLGGQVMSSKWLTTRRGSNKQEITFDFVRVDEMNNMRHQAYTWEVDVLEMSITGPRLDQLEEAASPDRSLIQQQERRVRAHEQELE